jgi:hypothetical protein
MGISGLGFKIPDMTLFQRLAYNRPKKALGMDLKGIGIHTSKR